MITARIDDHVRARWHVTLDASRACRSHLMEMMRRRIVLLCGVTLHTHTVAICPKPGTVRLVTIAARHTRVEHSALDEGPVFVVLFLYLAIRKIVVLIKQRDAV